MARFLLLLVAPLLFASELDYFWDEKESGRYALYAKLPDGVCSSIERGDMLLFLTSEGKIYRRRFRAKPGACVVSKSFYSMPSALRVLLFKPSTTEVIDLGVVEGE